jgi:hypothetical protein
VGGKVTSPASHAIARTCKVKVFFVRAQLVKEKELAAYA